MEAAQPIRVHGYHPTKQHEGGVVGKLDQRTKKERKTILFPSRVRVLMCRDKEQSRRRRKPAMGLTNKPTMKGRQQIKNKNKKCK